MDCRGDRGLWPRGNDPRFTVIADLSPGPRRTYQLPGRTGWRTGAASGKGSLLFVSGQTAEAVDGSVPRPTSHIKQAQLAYQNMGALLEQAGGSFADVLDFTSFHLDIRSRDISRISAIAGGQLLSKSFMPGILKSGH
jgi:enamine deaminase RidA (YjgF/YER057c/UK114 family)